MDARKTKRGKAARKGIGNAEPEEIVKAPHSIVINKGKLGKNGRELLSNVRNIMEPFTASRLKNIFKKKKVECQEQNASVIILSSDSESEHPDNISLENKDNVRKRRKGKKEKCKVVADTSVELIQICNKRFEKVEEKLDSLCNIFKKKKHEYQEQKTSVIILSSDSESEHPDNISLENKDNVRKRKKGKKEKCKAVADTSVELIQICNKPFEKVEEKLDSLCNQSIIPLAASNKSDIIEIPPKPRELRPVIIDGSNIARAHGKSTNTFSSKGIKISVDYFLKRGHKVTAFVPKYRQHWSKGPIVTTNPEILLILELTGNVVFTPSRRVNGKMYSCYDDRFIVQYATSNEGVILSNDNYKDLIDESPEFKETIEKRLLMFCFVGDTIMIPADPLGQKGPTLDEFLSTKR